MADNIKKVAMIEYQGRVDENNKALGHGPKVLNEYYDFIKDICQVSIYAPREILKEFSEAGNVKCKILPNKIVMGQDKSILRKLLNKVGMFNNISRALKDTDADTVWFFNVEYYFFLYLFLNGKSKKKIIATMFLDGYRGGLVARIKQKIMDIAEKKLDLIIATGPQLKFKNCSYRYVPDYYYDPEKYKLAYMNKRKAQAVCLGTMGKGKQLDELVDTFNRINYPLIIAGRFYDKDLLDNLRSKAASNIIIRDEYLSWDEYMQYLGESEYVVLPYSEMQYGHQTSGVLQETIFADAIPVAFEGVLKANDIEGVAFNSWNELDLDKITDAERIRIRNSYKNKRSQEYAYENVKEFYRTVFS